MATQNLKPDLTILLDAPVDQTLPRALRRIKKLKPGMAEDRFEKEKEAFHKRVRETFLQIAKKEPGRFFVVNAMDDSKRISETIAQKIEPLLKRGK